MPLIHTPSATPLLALVAATSAALTFPLTGGFSLYRFDLMNILPATGDDSLIAELSVDNQANWLTSGYISTVSGAIGVGAIGGATHAADELTTAIPLSGMGVNLPVVDNGRIGYSAVAHFVNPLSAGGRAALYGPMTYHDTAANKAVNGIFSGWYDTLAAFTDIRFRFTTNNISTGRIVMSGLHTG